MNAAGEYCCIIRMLRMIYMLRGFTFYRQDTERRCRFVVLVTLLAVVVVLLH